jgi:hypothetical protein
MEDLEAKRVIVIVPVDDLCLLVIAVHLYVWLCVFHLNIICIMRI